MVLRQLKSRLTDSLSEVLIAPNAKPLRRGSQIIKIRQYTEISFKRDKALYHLLQRWCKHQWTYNKKLALQPLSTRENYRIHRKLRPLLYVRMQSKKETKVLYIFSYTRKYTFCICLSCTLILKTPHHQIHPGTCEKVMK